MAKTGSQGKVTCKSCKKLVSSRGDQCPEDGCKGRYYLKKDGTQIDRKKRPVTEKKAKKGFTISDKQISAVTQVVLEYNKNKSVTASDLMDKTEEADLNKIIKDGMTDAEILAAIKETKESNEIPQLKGIGKPAINKILATVKKTIDPPAESAE